MPEGGIEVIIRFVKWFLSYRAPGSKLQLLLSGQGGEKELEFWIGERGDLTVVGEMPRSLEEWATNDARWPFKEKARAATA